MKYDTYAERDTPDVDDLTDKTTRVECTDCGALLWEEDGRMTSDDLYDLNESVDFVVDHRRDAVPENLYNGYLADGCCEKCLQIHWREQADLLNNMHK